MRRLTSYRFFFSKTSIFQLLIFIALTGVVLNRDSMYSGFISTRFKFAEILIKDKFDPTFKIIFTTLLNANVEITNDSHILDMREILFKMDHQKSPFNIFQFGN